MPLWQKSDFQMKKIIAFLLLGLFISSMLFAKAVSTKKAEQIAKNLYYEKVNQFEAVKYEEIKFTDKFTISDKVNPLYYIFNLTNNKGFVIIAAEDNVYPILGYTFKANYSEINQPPAFTALMESYKKQIAFVQENNLKSTSKINSVWDRYSSKSFEPNKNKDNVGPLLTTCWDQDRYYNEFCPVDPNGADGHARVGCVAVAMAQIMRYHSYPFQGTGSHGYNSTYGYLYVDFGAARYHWNNMPDYLTDYNSEVAKICYHCGVSVEMMYGPEGSGAYSSDVGPALITYFNYSPSAHLEYKWDYTAAEWENLLRTELDSFRPMYYSGSGPGGGHAFVCDGYQSDTYFHFNWGWGGLYNGYFYVSELNPGTHSFNDWQAALINLKSPLPPVADFTVNTTTVLTGSSINFMDLSAGIPTNWSWEFNGGTPGSSNEKNPVNITYNTPGIYDVTLTVANSNGTDNITKSNYITVCDSALPVADFTVSDTIVATGTSLNFTDLSLNNPDLWQWEFIPNTVTFINGTNANSQNPTVQFNEPVNYTVSLTATNSNGDDVITKTNLIYAGGLPLPYTEDFELGFFKDMWTIVNPDSGITWDGYYKLSGNLPSRKAAWMNFYAYSSIGERDRLISPLLNLSPYNSATLGFKHAYAIYNMSRRDSLIIYISTNGGTDWERIFAACDDGTGSFATHPPTTSEFVPQIPSDWCGVGYGCNCISIDLTPWAGNANVKIMFESYNGHGNSLYIDDLNICCDNYPPVITYFSPQDTAFTVSIDSTVTFLVSAYDIDSEISYSWFVNDVNQGITDSIFTYTFTEEGEFEIKSIVSDEEYSLATIWDVTAENPFGINDNLVVQLKTELGANYPNPFYPKTSISYSLKNNSKVILEIYNIKGQKVKTLVNSNVNVGNHKVFWNGKDDSGKAVSSGIYLYRLQAEKYTKIRKMVLMR